MLSFDRYDMRHQHLSFQNSEKYIKRARNQHAAQSAWQQGNMAAKRAPGSERERDEKSSEG